MDLVTRRAASIFVTCASLCTGAHADRVADPERVLLRPADNGAALINPGMGWLHHHYDNTLVQYGAPEKSTYVGRNFPGMSVIYLRLAWAYIEPGEGRFEWSVVDTPAQRWIEAGKKVAFRITNCESHDLYFATPRWVKDAGAEGYFFSREKNLDPNGPRWEPKYDDPVFLAKLDNFLAAFAARYDGSPHVAFVDVGSFGVWGEGHTYHSTKLLYKEEAYRKHIDLYAKHFKRTPIVAMDSFAYRLDEGILHYARQAGMGLRDDSIMVYPFRSDKIAQRFWPTLPVVLESQHYRMANKAGTWKDGLEYLRAVEVYHASYVSCHHYPTEFVAQERALIDKINLRLGYRLQLREMSWPKRVPADGRLTVSYTWCNAGVAPCYGGGHPAVTLKDAEGGIVGVFVDEAFNVRDLPPTPTGADAGTVAQRHEAEFGLIPRVLLRDDASEPGRLKKARDAVMLRAGSYDVFISVGSRLGTPKIALPIDGDDGQRRYRVGTIEVE